MGIIIIIDGGGLRDRNGNGGEVWEGERRYHGGYMVHNTRWTTLTEWREKVHKGKYIKRNQKGLRKKKKKKKKLVFYRKVRTD